MKLRIDIIDPYDGDRAPGEWAVDVGFVWFRTGLGMGGFRGFVATLFRWQFILGQEVEL